MYPEESLGRLLHMTFFQSVVAMVIISHMAAAFTDPGIVARDTSGVYLKEFERQLEIAKKVDNISNTMSIRKLNRSFCRKCATPKPAGAHHCKICNRCVRKMVSPVIFRYQY